MSHTLTDIMDPLEGNIEDKDKDDNVKSYKQKKKKNDSKRKRGLEEDVDGDGDADMEDGGVPLHEEDGEDGLQTLENAQDASWKDLTLKDKKEQKPKERRREQLEIQQGAKEDEKKGSSGNGLKVPVMEKKQKKRKIHNQESSKLRGEEDKINQTSEKITKTSKEQKREKQEYPVSDIGNVVAHEGSLKSKEKRKNERTMLTNHPKDWCNMEMKPRSAMEGMMTLERSGR